MDIQGALTVGVTVVAADYVLGMAVPGQYMGLPRPAQLLVAGAVGSIAYGLLMTSGTKV